MNICLEVSKVIGVIRVPPKSAKSWMTMTSYFSSGDDWGSLIETHDEQRHEFLTAGGAVSGAQRNFFCSPMELNLGYGQICQIGFDSFFMGLKQTKNVVD